MILPTRKHLFIPDLQIQPGVDISHLNAIGNYILKVRPDVIIQAGDFAEMHSLSSYDTGKKAGEGARYREDINAARKGMETLMQPLYTYWQSQRKNKKRLYSPIRIITLGNHENRINKHINNYPVLEGSLGINDFDFQRHGWKVIPFLEVARVDGILYSHYFPRNATGRIVQTYRGAPCARTQVLREGQSATAGHLQGLDFHVQQRGNRRDYGLIAGSCYLHDHEYLSPQGTNEWRGIVVKHEVHQGSYDPMFVSINYLMSKWWDGKRRYA